MKSKSKIKATLIRQDTVNTNEARYTYSLLGRESTSVASYRIPLYSVRIEMIDSKGKLTESTLEDAFSDIGKAVVFYDKLRENLATPVNLAYVFEDEKQ